MRNSFASELYENIKIDSDIILLTGDIGNRLFDPIKERHPKQFINCGIAEQSMIGIAAGMATIGLKPIVYTITPFVTYRCFEQIRVDLCYNDLKVIIVGTGSGLSYSTLGPTHQSLEDVAIMRALPGMTVFSPCDPDEVRYGLRAAIQHDGPVYLRLGKKGEAHIYENKNKKIEFGRSSTIREGSDVCIVGYGPILQSALIAADTLEAKGVSCRVENFHTIKPIDKEKLREVSKIFKSLIVLEEHSSIGGLFGALSEFYSAEQNRPFLFSLGTDDEFLHKIGDQTFARKYFGICADSIVENAMTLLEENFDNRT